MTPRACPRGCVGPCELAKRSHPHPGETLYTARPNNLADPTPDKCWLMVDVDRLDPKTRADWLRIKADADDKRKDEKGDS